MAASNTAMRGLLRLAGRRATAMDSRQTWTAALCPSCSLWQDFQCHGNFSTTRAPSSGHNRWSKIRHEKGAADKNKMAQRHQFAKSLTLYSKLYGANPELNTSLANVIAAAKRSGLPKANIDAAIARGQGRSTSGDQLEPALLEVLAPGSVALVIDIETDNKNRSIKDLRSIAKKHSATVAPTSFLFTRQGQTILRPEAGLDNEEVMMRAMTDGVEDLDQDQEGNLVVWTEPSKTHHAAQNLSKSIPAEIVSSGIIWTPTAERIKIDDPEAGQGLATFLAAVRDYADVQSVYSNAEKGDIPVGLWSSIQEHLD